MTAAQSGAVKLTWKPVKISGKVTYGIYYGKTVDEITQRRKYFLHLPSMNF